MPYKLSKQLSQIPLYDCIGKIMIEYTGREYLHIDIANNYGLDKLSFEERIAWSKSHKGFQDNPDNEIGYLKARAALKEADQGHPIGHLMSLDACASFAQIMSCLSGCETTAKAIGLTGNVRKDIYSEVAVAMGSTRELVKDALMPYFYGSERNPMKVFGERVAEFKRAIRDILPGAADVRDTLQQSWQPYQLCHSWVLPDGFRVEADVNQVVREFIDWEFNSTLCFMATINKGRKRAVKNIANVVQSIDAWICREMVLRCEFPLLTIHDSFWCHPNNMNTVRRTYQKIMSELALMNLLDQILLSITHEISGYDKLGSGKQLSHAITKAEYLLS